MTSFSLSSGQGAGRRWSRGMTGLVCGMVALLLSACGGTTIQETDKSYEVGIYFDVTNANLMARFDGLKEGMKGVGYTEGKNIRYTTLDTSGKTVEEDKAALVAFAAKNYDAYWTVSATAATKLKEVVTKKPIVVAGLVDAVQAGLIKSAEKPGGNLTGVDPLNTVLAPKRMEMALKVDPGIKAVYVVYNPKTAVQALQVPVMRETAARLGVKIIEKQVGSKEESLQVIPQFSAAEAQAIVPIGLLAFSLSGPEFKSVVAREKLLLVGMERGNLDTGALFVYGANSFAIGKQSTEYVYRVLRGVDPGTLPVLQPDKFEFILSQKTADQLGRKLSESILTSADEIIK